MQISRILWEVKQTLLLPSDRKSDICYHLDPIFKVTNFEMRISKKQWASENTQVCAYKGRYLLFNCTTANVVFYDPDLNFQDHKFETKSRKWELSQNCAMTFTVL